MGLSASPAQLDSSTEAAQPKLTAQGDEEEDYLTMALPSVPAPTQKETYTQRRLRIQRESEARARQPSKKELEKIRTAQREEALAKKLEQSNKGFKMLSRMGYKPGAALGSAANKDARTEPIALDVKEGRGGIGLDAERKRKVREEMEGEVRRTAEEQEGFRERIAREREERRREAQLRAAMGVAEGLDEEDTKRESGVEKKTVNILWRGLRRDRERRERDRRARHDLTQSLSRNPAYANGDSEGEEGVGKVEEVVEEEDEELDEWEQKPVEDKLEEVVGFLRSMWWYCFWCKCRYKSEEMDGCPGRTEEDHD